MASRFENRTVLITGAASGLGKTCAAGFLAEGARLVMVDRDAERLDETARRLGAPPEMLRTLAGDVGDPDTATRAVALAVEAFGRLDVLLSNAAIDPRSAGSVCETSDADWHAVLTVNLSAAFFFSRAAIPVLRDGGGGAIVATASIGALKPTPHEAAYCVSKAGLVHLMRSIALDHAADRIRANAVCPGYLEAVMSDRRGTMTAGMLAERSQAAGAAVPLGREGRYDEVARAVLFLADPAESGYVTGTVLTIDGGATLA